MDHLAGQAQISFRSGAIQVKNDHRTAVGRGFADPDIAGDYSFVDLVAEKVADIIDHHMRQIVSAVMHGQHDALYFEARIESPLNAFNGFD